MQTLIYEYNKVNFLGTIFSSALIFHILEKVLFNWFAYKKLVIDTWSIVDFISSAINLFCFNYIGSVNVDQILGTSTKQTLDAYVICVTVVSWLRCFSYFLLVRTISKLLHTLFRMIKDTTSFIFLMGCYFCVMATIFTMLFQTADPSRFATVMLTVRVLFDAVIGSYGYLDWEPGYEVSFSILMIAHVTMSHIFLLNFLVALLSTVFSVMNEEVGEFKFRCNKYQFIEKYSVPMLDPDGYKELVVHPPPLNFFTFPMLFGVFSRNCMRGCGGYFSKFIFWLENVPLIFIFLCYELALAPIAYFKQLSAFVIKSTWKNVLFLFIFWAALGPLIILLLGVVGDLINLLRVLADYKQADEEEKERVETETRKDKVILYNELMDVLRAIMHIYNKSDDEERGRRKKLL